MAIRKVLKMIEKRERALMNKNPTQYQPPKLVMEYDSDNAREALKILGVAESDPQWKDEGDRWLRVATWATQAALSRPGRRKFDKEEVKDIKFFTLDADKLRWPRGRLA